MAVTGDGIDFTVVRHVAERLRQRPARNGVGRKALVEQANGRFQTQIRQIEIKTRQVGGHAQPFINIDLIRKATDVELFVSQRFDTFFAATACHIKAALHVARAPAGRSIDKQLFNTWQRGEGDFTQHILIGRHIAPAHYRQRFTLNFFLHNAAARLSLFRILVEEQHANGVVFCQAPAFLFGHHAEKAIGFL